MKANRTLLLTLITIIFCAFTVDAYDITAQKTDAKTVRVKAKEFYLGDNDNVAAFSFYFDNVSAMCNLMVSTRNKAGLVMKPISVIFYMADGTRLIFGSVKSDDFAIFLLDFLNCVSSDFKGNYENASLSARNVCGLNKLSTVDIKSIVVNNVKVPVTTPTAATFRQIIQKGISMLSDKSSYSGYLSGKSSAQSTTKKIQTTKKHSSPNNSYKQTAKSQEKEEAKKREKDIRIQKEIDKKLSGENELAVSCPTTITVRDIMTKVLGLKEVKNNIWELPLDYVFWEIRKEPAWESEQPNYPVKLLGKEIFFGWSRNAKNKYCDQSYYFMMSFGKNKKACKEYLETLKTEFLKNEVELKKLSSKNWNIKNAWGGIKDGTYYEIHINLGSFSSVTIYEYPICSESFQWIKKNNPSLF